MRITIELQLFSLCIFFPDFEVKYEFDIFLEIHFLMHVYCLFLCRASVYVIHIYTVLGWFQSLYRAAVKNMPSLNFTTNSSV